MQDTLLPHTDNYCTICCPTEIIVSFTGGWVLLLTQTNVISLVDHMSSFHIAKCYDGITNEHTYCLWLAMQESQVMKEHTVKQTVLLPLMS